MSRAASSTESNLSLDEIRGQQVTADSVLPCSDLTSTLGAQHRLNTLKKRPEALLRVDLVDRHSVGAGGRIIGG